MLMQNFGVTKKEHYGMLWYFLEWSISSSLSSMRSRTVAVSNGIVLSSPQSKRKNDENSLLIWGFGTSWGLKWIPASPTKSGSGTFCCRCFLNFPTKTPPIDYPQDPLVAYGTFWLGVPCEGTWGSTVFFKIGTVDYFSNKSRTASGWLWGCRVLCTQYTLISKVQKQIIYGLEVLSWVTCEALNRELELADLKQAAW